MSIDYLVANMKQRQVSGHSSNSTGLATAKLDTQLIKGEESSEAKLDFVQRFNAVNNSAIGKFLSLSLSLFLFFIGLRVIA